MLAKPRAKDSPKGKRPLSKPLMNRPSPTRTDTIPMATLPRSGKGCRSTTIWKKAMTRTMGARSRNESSNCRAMGARNWTYSFSHRVRAWRTNIATTTGGI